MHPALSVIAFTSLSGMGYGLAIVLGTGHGNPAALSTKIAWLLALVLIAGGLCCSLLHLGNPQRAWRAFSQWRSSWLSREGVLAVVTFLPLTMLAGMSIFYNSFDLRLGYIGAVLSLATVFSTSMIYASLRTIATWHTAWTPATYIGSAMTGGTLIYLSFFGHPAGTASNQIWVYLAYVFLIISALIKFMWNRRARLVGFGKSTMESATGLGDLGAVRLLERPHGTGNYLTNEMAFRIGRKHQQQLHRISLLLSLILPLILLALSLAISAVGTVLQIGALLSFAAGLFVERWLFFATAKHVIGLYYGGEDALQPAEDRR